MSTWTRQGSTLTVSDAACPSIDGSYTLAFAADCSSFLAAAVSDPCSFRDAYLDGHRFLKQTSCAFGCP
jgi:hypothetical protein